MNRLRIIKDPVARKRWRRFRKSRRAWWSLWILFGLYGLSLASELICNDRPLYVRFQGQSYFPIFKYVPEDLFTGSGRQTRPDYKQLARSPLFTDEPGHVMIFAPFRFGPNEIIDADSLQAERKTIVSIKPEPRIARISMDRQGRIVDPARADYFFPGAEQPAGRPLTAFWPLPEDWTKALDKRWANREAERISATLVSRTTPARSATISLATFSPRTRPPETLRLLLREMIESADAQTLTFGADGSLQGVPPPVWERMNGQQREQVRLLARQAFEGPVRSQPLDVAGDRLRLEAESRQVRWPYPPTAGHWLGIDSSGRDVLARILYGMRISVSFGLLLVAGSMALGTLIGALQGFYGGKVDITTQRLIEIWSALPFLYVMILMGAVYGRSFALLLFCYGLFHWIGLSYYMRGEFLRLRKRPFVEAARALGLPTRRLILRHILPNALTPLITLAPFSLVAAIGALASLDYLGFGLPPPAPSWGQLLQQAQQFRWAWWLILYPALALFTVMLLGAFIGEGVRDAYDARVYSRIR